jgi:diguanylate cyclase (GGDEF)-like protein
VFTVRNRAERRSGAAALLLGAAATALLWAWRSGPGGAVWCYPLVVAAFMMLPLLPASLFNVGLLASAAAFVSRSAGTDVALRFALSLGLVIAIVASMLRTVGDLHQRLREQAITDPLTGAFNRRHLDACLTMAIERRNRTGEPASLLLVDVDHFKAINDAFGHPAGDEVLRTIVGIIGGRMRTLDVLFRIGGEEFALLLAGARHVDALAVGEDLRLLVEDSRPIEGGAVSISIGVSELQRGTSAYGWLADADAALYRAKRGGRNRVAGRPLASAS